MKSFFTKNVIIALTVIASLCLLFWGIEFLKGINLFKPANFYYSEFEKVDGLTVSAPITINGFQVGQVREINYDYNSNKISVLLSLDKGLKLPQGTTVTLASDLLGTASLAMNLGKSATYYNVGDEIPSAVSAGLMDAVGNDLMPQLSAILPKLDSILGNVNALTSNPALYASVSRLDAITADLAKTSSQLNHMVAQLDNSVPGVMTNVNGLTANLNKTGANVNELSAKLNNQPIDSIVGNLNVAVANLKALSDNLNNRNSSLGLLLNDAALYNNANNSVASLDSLLRDIKANPKRYVTIKVF